MTAYRTRLLDPLLEELLRDLPALLVVGPRSVGRRKQLHPRTTPMRLYGNSTNPSCSTSGGWSRPSSVR
ncbi:MAG TPA: hypothetical protein VIH55_01740 [Acidimicrobiia bacterium]